MFNILKEKKIASLMKVLSNMYEKSLTSNKVYLMYCLFNLKLSESISDRINEFNLIISQLSSIDISFKDEVRALIPLSFLPESWDTTVTTVSNPCNSSK